MKILLCCVPYDSGKSGISVYIDNVLKELTLAKHELTLLIEEESSQHFKNHKCWIMPKYANRAIGSIFYMLLILPFKIKKQDFDRVILTAGNRRALAFSKVELLAVIHDLSQYNVPVKYDALRMFYIKHTLPYFINRACPIIVAISHNTAKDLIKYWHIEAGKIVVSYNGIDRTKLKYNINDASQKSVIYVSRIEVPGKNHSRLIEAWNTLPPALAQEYKLILVGSDWSGAEKIHQQAVASPYASNIEFTGFISDENLDKLYRTASLYIFPSLYEGFGLSLIEAMYTGLVCCCSKNSALGEIAGKAAITFDPTSVVEIGATLKNLLTNDDLRKELKEAGLKHQELFQWSTHAQTLASKPKLKSTLFGVTFTTDTMAEALEGVEKMVKSPTSHFVAFVNADCLNQAYNNPRYRENLKKASYVWPDGLGVRIGAKHLHTPLKGNVNGTDMLPYLCQKGYRLFLLGGAPDIAKQAEQRLKKLYFNTNIVEVNDGFFASEDLDKVLAKINRAKPEILLVAMGVPTQEQWICDNIAKLDNVVAIGVGGLLDFASGRISRAPLWLRKLHQEWIFRLYNEPIRLFKRYIIGNPLFLIRLYFSSGNRDRFR